MAQYTVQDEMTGKTVTFEWEGAKPPGDKDMRDIFSAARKSAPPKPGNYTKTTTRNSWGGEDPYAGEKETQQTWLPESSGGIPRWGLENPSLWGLRGAGLELYDKGVQPAVEAAGMVAGSFGSPVVGTALGYGAAKKAGEMGRGFLERAGMPENLQRRQKGVVEELTSSAKDVAEPLVVGAMFNKAAKMMQPIDDAITAAIKKGVDKGIKPTVVGKKLYGQAQQYYENAENAIKTIIGNKKNLKLTTPFGDVAKNQIPQDLRQFQEAIHQTKNSVFKEYDALRKLTGESGATVSGEGVVRALRQFIGDDAIKTLSPANYKYAQKLIERFTANRAGTTVKTLATGSESAYKQFSPEEAQNMIKSLNASLKAFYKNPSYNTAKRAYVDKLVVNNLRKSMDDSVMGATGQSYQALKNKYGSLKSIEEEVGHRLVVDSRKGGKGLIDFSDVFTGYHAIKGILSMEPAAVGASAGAKTIAWIYRQGNQPNYQVKKMFSRVDKLMQKRGVVENTPVIPQVKPKVVTPYSTRQRVPTAEQKMTFVKGKQTSMGNVKPRVPTTKQSPESYKITPEHGTGMTKKVKKKLETPEYVSHPAIKLKDGTVVEADYSKGGHIDIVNKIDKSPKLKKLFDEGNYVEGAMTHKGRFVQRKSDVDFTEIKGRNIYEIRNKLKRGR